MRNYFTFAGRQSVSFGIYTNGRETFGSPAPSYEFIQVPGRNGDIIMDNKRFENYDLNYAASFIFEDFKTNIEEFRKFVLSFNTYQRLTDTYHPNEYRMAIFKDAFEPEVTDSHEVGQFDIVFNCKPQRFLISGEEKTSYTSSPIELVNPTTFYAKPLMTVYGHGTIEMNGTTIAISDLDESEESINLDFEMMNAYYINPSTSILSLRNNHITLSSLDYPLLKPGVNNIAFGSGITKIDIVPRWYII